MIKLSTKQPARHPNPTVKATGLAHLIFQRPDLKQAEKFLNNFGLVVAKRSQDSLYFRATSWSPYCYRVERAKHAGFVGFGLRVGSKKALEKLASLPGASRVQESPHPGGGEYVALIDPSGFTIEAIHGQEMVNQLPSRAPMPLNIGETRHRINETQRAPIKPPDIIKLGHVVIDVADFQATCAWYTQHFGFIPSDVQVLPDGSPVVVFMRLDLGERPADHHTLAIGQGLRPGYNHSAYEVVDVDGVGMGQRVLQERGYKHAWGIGRHILGSQIFDYWEDPWEDKHEHYCDGDLFTDAVPLGVQAASREAMSQWGPVMPTTFVTPQLHLNNVAEIVSHMRHSPDLSLGKLMKLKKAFA